MTSRRPITERPAYGHSGAGNHRRLCAAPSVRRDRRGRAVMFESRNAVNSVVRRPSPTCRHFCLGRMTRNSQEVWTILVVSDEPARSVVKRLRKADCVESDGRASHTKWRDPESAEYVVVATGHRMISATGVHRVNKAIERSKMGS
jgi:hypothetical protein